MKKNNNKMLVNLDDLFEQYCMYSFKFSLALESRKVLKEVQNDYKTTMSDTAVALLYLTMWRTNAHQQYWNLVIYLRIINEILNNYFYKMWSERIVIPVMLNYCSSKSNFSLIMMEYFS